MADIGEKAPPIYANEKAVSSHEGKFANPEQRRQSLAGDEAADIYGNAGSAAEFGYVERA
jgi:hypothetical protein